MIFSKILAMLRWLIDEPNPASSRYSSDTISDSVSGEEFLKAVINDAFKAVARKYEWSWLRKFKSDISVTVNDGYFFLPPDFAKSIKLTDPDNDIVFKEITDIEAMKQDPTLDDDSSSPSWYYLGEQDNEVKETMTALADTGVSSVKFTGCAGAVDDYYNDWYIVNKEREGKARVLDSSWSDPNMTLTLDREISGQTEGDTIYLKRCARKVYLFPVNSEALSLTLRYQVQPYELINSYDESQMPDGFIWTVIYLAAAQLTRHKDREQSGDYYAIYKSKLDNMKLEESSPDLHFKRDDGLDVDGWL